MISPRRYEVYKLLAGFDGTKHNLSQAAEVLGISPKNVHKHKKYLVKGGYLVPIKGTNFYDRGPNAKFIETPEVKRRLTGLDETDNASSNTLPPDPFKAQEINQDTLRIHLNGSIIFDVDKIGDHSTITYHPPGGQEQHIPFLEATPFNKHNGEQYKGRLRLPGRPWDSAVRLHSTVSGDWLAIWPPEVHITKSEIPENEFPFQFFSKDVYEILHFLEHWGGWRFKKESARYINKVTGKTEFGYSSPIINNMIPDGISGIIGKSDTWIDESPGKGLKELEADELKKAGSWLNNYDEHRTLDEKYNHIVKRLHRHLDILDDMAKALEAQAEILRAKDLQAEIEKRKQTKLGEGMYR